MRRLFKYKFPIAGFGIAACVFLIISRYLGGFTSGGMQALNHILVVAVLCICVHMVRRTASLLYIHVWNDRFLSFLWCMPVFNLLITAFQLISDDKRFFLSPVFVAVSILFSLPAFFCLYYVFAVVKLCGALPLKICCAVLCTAGGAYTVLRLFDRIVFPQLEAAGKTVGEGFLEIAAASSPLSVVIYALTAVCLAVFVAVYARRKA